MLPWALGFAGAIYGATAAMGGALFVAFAGRLRMADEGDRLRLPPLCVFHCLPVRPLFAALLVSNVSNRAAIDACMNELSR
jgi:protoheme IX farnesyltransferase